MANSLFDRPWLENLRRFSGILTHSLDSTALLKQFLPQEGDGWLSGAFTLNNSGTVTLSNSSTAVQNATLGSAGATGPPGPLGPAGPL